MAPRPPDPIWAVIARLNRHRERLATVPLRFGAPHQHHAVVLEGGRYRVRELALDPAKADAFRARTGRFMPEDAEDLSEPTGPVVLDCATFEELLAELPKKFS